MNIQGGPPAYRPAMLPVVHPVLGVLDVKDLLGWIESLPSPPPEYVRLPEFAQLLRFTGIVEDPATGNDNVIYQEPLRMPATVNGGRIVQTAKVLPPPLNILQPQICVPKAVDDVPSNCTEPHHHDHHHHGRSRSPYKETPVQAAKRALNTYFRVKQPLKKPRGRPPNYKPLPGPAPPTRRLLPKPGRDLTDPAAAALLLHQLVALAHIRQQRLSQLDAPRSAAIEKNKTPDRRRPQQVGEPALKEVAKPTAPAPQAKGAGKGGAQRPRTKKPKDPAGLDGVVGYVWVKCTPKDEPRPVVIWHTYDPTTGRDKDM